MSPSNNTSSTSSPQTSGLHAGSTGYPTPITPTQTQLTQPTSPANVALTLFDLPDFGNDDPGATEAVKYLLQAVGRNIVALQRNTNVSYMVAERARDIYKAINECIITVETSEEEDWASFEKFSNAIDPLEEVLFKLLTFASDEKEQHLAQTSSTSACVASPETWAAKRRDISDILDVFYESKELIALLNVPDTRKQDHEDAQFYDDRTLLEEIRAKIQAVLSKEAKKFPTYVNEINTHLDELQNEVISGSPRAPAWLAVLTIQTSMLIQGVVEILNETSDIEIRNRLKSKPLWDTASELITLLVKNKTKSTSPGEASEKYDIFIKLILASIDVVLPESFVELMKRVGRIRRPFQAQAVTVVMLCRTLAEKFHKLDNSEINAQKFDSLEAAFDKTLQALEGATRAVPDLKSFNLSDFKKNKTVLEFGLAEKLIEGGFRSLNLVTEWEQKQTDLTNAVTKDEKRLKDLHGILNKGSGYQSTKVKVNVTIHEKSIDGKELDTTSLDGEAAMRLSALRWSVAGSLEEDKKHAARTDGIFYKPLGDKWSKVSVHAKLDEIAGNKPEVTLKLVVPVA